MGRYGVVTDYHPNSWWNMKKPNGYILWRGASLLDGAPIVVIGIRKSGNSKTGRMLQTYILRADMSPVDAIRSGADSSICGSCPHRGRVENGRNRGRTCYVNIGQGPTGVYKAFKRGVYHACDDIEAFGERQLVRLGTYGDPGAVPGWVWSTLIRRAVGHTGYTHQWQSRPDLRHLVMASADTPKAASWAHSMGWRTFRVALPGQIDRLPREAICPASAEAGRKLTCETCRACNGAGTGTRGSVVIRAHGGTAVMANVARMSSAA